MRVSTQACEHISNLQNLSVRFVTRYIFGCWEATLKRHIIIIIIIIIIISFCLLFSFRSLLFLSFLVLMHLFSCLLKI